MKSKSISLFAALIIVLGIGSAFTTKNQNKKQLKVYAVWGIPEQVANPYNDPASVSDLSCAISEVLYYSLSPLSFSGFANLEEFRQEYTNGELMCHPYTSDYVCMAYLTYKIGFYNSGTVLDIIEGDYHILVKVLTYKYNQYEKKFNYRVITTYHFLFCDKCVYNKIS